MVFFTCSFQDVSKASPAVLQDGGKVQRRETTQLGLVAEVSLSLASPPPLLMILHSVCTRFPEQVKFLRKLPMPSSLSKSTTALSLYDWISTHVSW